MEGILQCNEPILTFCSNAYERSEDKHFFRFEMLMFIMYRTLWRYFHRKPKNRVVGRVQYDRRCVFRCLCLHSELSTASDLYCSLAEITYQKHPTL